MQFPAVTALYAALLTLILVALSAWVIVGRWQYKVSLGDGSSPYLRERIRAQGNFVEYVPMALLLTAFLEASHTSRIVIHALLLPLLIARMLHPVGLVAPAGSTRHTVLRAGSMMVTFVVLVGAAVLLLARGL